MSIIDELEKIGLVPVIKINKINQAKSLAVSLLEAGLPCAEITFRSEIADKAIYEIKQNFPDMIVGAGTVLNKNQVDKAINSGADFIVSPGINKEIVRYCILKDIPIFPGCANASEIELAISLGLNIVKFFPSEILGGINAINSYSGPYASIKFFPTGGINGDNISEYIKNKNVFACGGSWIVSPNYVNNEDYEGIKYLAKDAIKKMLDFKLKHIGINCSDFDEALELTNYLQNAFGFKKEENENSFFLGDCMEILKKPFLGKNGHIAISTNSIERAVRFLEFKNIKFDYKTASYKDGILQTIYFNNEVGGFAIHLVRSED